MPPEITRPSARADTGRAQARPEPSGGRVVWADVAKGLCILLVVLHHVTSKHLPAVMADDTLVLTLWQGLDQALKPLRMPLFFLVSGAFAASAIRRPWSAVLGPRVLSSYWLYVVWLSIQAPLFLFVATRIGTHRVNDLGEWLLNLVVAGTGLWYLYGLAVYVVVAKLLAGLPRLPVLAAAAALSAAASWIPTHGVNRFSLLHCLVFFLLGAYAPELLRRVRRGSPGAVVAGLAGYGVLAALLQHVDVPRSVFLLAVAPVVMWLGVQAAIRLARRPRAGDVLAALGRRTLPVYVLHMPLLGLLHQLVVEQLPLPVGVFAAGGQLGVGALVGLAYPVLLTALVTSACLGLERAGTAGGLGWLFRAPEALTRRRDRVAPQRA